MDVSNSTVAGVVGQSACPPPLPPATSTRNGDPVPRSPFGCINLRERFGKRYKVAYEESYCCEHGEGARVESPVHMILLCRYGHLYPAGGNRLAASVDGHPGIAKKLKRLDCIEIHQDGDFGELSVLFDVADFDRVARIMKPRRRRRMSEAQRAAAAERLRKYQPAPGQRVGHIARQSEIEAPESLPRGELV